MYSEKNPKVIGVVNHVINRMEHNFMLSMSGSLQDNFGGKNSYKSTKYWPSYYIMCQLALFGVNSILTGLFR